MASLPRLSLQALLLAILLATFTRTFVVQGVHIPSGSMSPALVAGDHALVGKLIYQTPRTGPLAPFRPSRAVRRGDVVVFRSPSDPGTLLVKRCVGLPGEVVSVTAHPVSVPRGHYFVLGDDRQGSYDSRDFGPIPHAALVGRVTLVYWSLRPRASDLDEGAVRRLFSGTRWNRTFHVVR